MGKKIKIIYLILGILVLILLITGLAVWISKQIDFKFFTFNTKICLTNYISNEYSTKKILSMTDEEIELVSQIWNLDKTELFSIREIDSYYSKLERDCYVKYINKNYNPNRIAWNISSYPKYEQYKACINELGIPDFHKLENFIKDKELNINRKLKKQLISKGVCIRPLFLK